MSYVEGTIRAETPEDREAIRDLLADAFGRTTEATIVERLRTDHADAFGPALVAELDGQVVGYVCCSLMHLDEEPDLRLLALGPIGVLPARQAMGIGSALITRIQELVSDPIALLGDPGWYGRFGFRSAAELGIRSQWNDVGDAWMVWFPEGSDQDRYRGTARYLAPFDEDEPPPVDGAEGQP